MFVSIIGRLRSISRNDDADFLEADLPGKLDPYKSYGAKLIGLFARLMFSKRIFLVMNVCRANTWLQRAKAQMVD